MRKGTHTAIAAPLFGTLAESRTNKTPYISVPLTIEGGDCDNEVIEYCAWLSPRALTKTVESLKKAFGWDGNIDNLACHQDHDGRCQITVDEETNDKGRKFFKVAWVNPLDSPMDTSRRQSLADQLREQCRNAAAAVAAPAPRQPSHPNAPAPGATAVPGVPDDSEEVPF